MLFLRFGTIRKGTRTGIVCASLCGNIVNALVMSGYDLKIQDTGELLARCYVYGATLGIMSLKKKPNDEQLGLLLHQSKRVIRDWLRKVYREAGLSGQPLTEAVETVLSTFDGFYTEWFNMLNVRIEHEMSTRLVVDLNYLTSDTFMNTVFSYLTERFHTAPEDIKDTLITYAEEAVLKLGLPGDPELWGTRLNI